jgi:hypothetical protein
VESAMPPGCRRSAPTHRLRLPATGRSVRSLRQVLRQAASSRRPISARRSGSSNHAVCDQKGHLSARAAGSRPAGSRAFAGGARRSLGHLSLRALEIGDLPTRGDQQEYRPIGVIARSRPGLFPSACNDLSVSIVQSPVPASTALDDDKFQHRSLQHRLGRIIPHREPLWARLARRRVVLWYDAQDYYASKTRR